MSTAPQPPGWNQLSWRGRYRRVSDLIKQNGQFLANAVTVILLLGAILFAYATDPNVIPNKMPPPVPTALSKSTCPKAGHKSARTARRAKVSDASGATAALNIFIGRAGGPQQRASTPLAVQSRSLPAGAFLCTATSDLVRDDGESLPANQVKSWAQVDNDGGHVTIFVSVAPRYLQLSDFGGYTGTVALDDARATGGNVALNVHVPYPYVNRVLIATIIAAVAGLTWAWFIHTTSVGTIEAQEQFWPSLALRVAVVAAAIPVLNAQVLTNPDWKGDLSQYIGLVTLAGAAAIAATPTLRALVSRVGRAGPKPRD
jgi:hypothetical protein